MMIITKRIKILVSLLLLLFISSIQCYSQTTKQIDYFNTLELNISDLQDYMLNQGFQFNKSAVDELGEIYTWDYNRSRYDPSAAECFFRLYIYNDNIRSISFQSQIKGDYIRFKTTIKNKGLKFDKTEIIDGALVETYSNSNYESRIWISNDGMTSYEMNLEKIK